MQLPIEITITHKGESKVTSEKSVTEYHLTADSTAHASSMLAGCTNLTRIMALADLVIRDGQVIKTRDIQPAPVQAVVVPPKVKP